MGTKLHNWKKTSDCEEYFKIGNKIENKTLRLEAKLLNLEQNFYIWNKTVKKFEQNFKIKSIRYL